VTDRRTDGETDGFAIAKRRAPRMFEAASNARNADYCESESLSARHAAALCKHGWTGRGPAWYGDPRDARNIVIDQSSDFPPRTRCGFRQITFATCYNECLLNATPLLAVGKTGS